MLKQTLIAGAALALAAVPALAWGGTHVHDSFNTSAEVNNHATVTNTTVTVANTGLNFTSANGGNNTATTTSGEAEKGGTTGDTNGAAYVGGASNTVVTGNAGASSSVTNVVNTTVVRQ